ncbi:MAG TPA: hypothetical protein VGX78_15400 [Pirellulales bacterium]|jgi:hypothetical protein|nr:hypothetical protein [Pirellulales bacterium]
MENNPTDDNEGATATLERGFVRRVTTLNPRSWVTNNAAGVHYMTRNYPYQTLIRFDLEPSAGVVDFLEKNGFRWKIEPQHWARTIGYKTAAEDREIGRRTFGAVVEMLLAEKSVRGQSRLF